MPTFPGKTTLHGNVQVQNAAPSTTPVFPSTGGSLAVQGPFPWTDVRAFGATGDGVTDDIDAIEAAAAALPPEGGTVFFPPGRYLISRAWAPTGCIVIAGMSRGLAGPISRPRSSVLYLAPFETLFGWVSVGGVSVAIDLTGADATIQGMVIESNVDLRIVDPPDPLAAVVYGAPRLVDTIIRNVRPVSAASSVFGVIDDGGSTAVSTSIHQCGGGLLVKGSGRTRWDSCYLGNQVGADSGGTNNLRVDPAEAPADIVFRDCVFDENFSATPSVMLTSAAQNVVFIGCLAFSSGAKRAHAVEDHGRGNRFIASNIEAWDMNNGKPIGAYDGADTRFTSCLVSARPTVKGKPPIPYYFVEEGSSLHFFGTTFLHGTFENGGTGSVRIVDGASIMTERLEQASMQLGDMQMGTKRFGVFTPRTTRMLANYRITSETRVQGANLDYWTVQLEHYRGGVLQAPLGVVTTQLSGGGTVRPFEAWGPDEARELEEGDTLFLSFTATGEPEPFTSIGCTLEFAPT